MKNSLVRKYLPVCCLLATTLGVNQALQAQQPYNQRYNQRYGNFPPASIDQQLQGDPNAGNRPVERQPQPQRPRSSNPWDTGYRSAPYPPQNHPPQRYQAPYYGGNPYGGGPSSSGPRSNRGSGFSSPWNNRGSNFSGPWNNRGSGFSPWGGRGGRDPFGNRGPEDWFDPGKGSMSRNWDDALDAPSRMGEMPGGWTAPSVSAPNPIDVGEEFGDATRDAPDQMDNFNWNNNRGRRY